MREWTESEINWYLEALAKNDTHDLARALFQIALLIRPYPFPVPTGNKQVVEYLEQLVKDRRGCVVDWRTPHTFGELRWLAARVLACEYAFLGIEEAIILKDVVQPLRNWEFFPRDKKYQGVKMTFDELIQAAIFPTKTEVIYPQKYAWCCTKEAVEVRRRNQHKNE